MKNKNDRGRTVKREKVIYFSVLALCIVVLAIGIFSATRGGDSFYASADGTLYLRAKVSEIVETLDEYGDDGELIESNIVFRARITSSGEHKGETVISHQNYSSYAHFNPQIVKAGDSVIVGLFEGDENWYFIDFVRSDAIIVLVCLFAALLILFGRKKGLKTVLSLALTVAAVIFVFFPAVILGGNIYFWAVAVCIYIIVMTLCITDGISRMSLAASLGCVGGVLVSLLLTFITDAFIHITGNADPNSIHLVYIGDGIDLRALVYASIIIGSVGAVMDVAVDISASLKEIAAKVKSVKMRELFASGLNIGRDVIGTMSNTLILAYIGGSMCSLLLYFYNNMANSVYLFNIESIIVEMLKILVGSIGILMTLPLTALISAWLYTHSAGKNKAEETVSAKDEYSEMLESVEGFCARETEDKK